jgi:VCBS repeat-containing protein
MNGVMRFFIIGALTFNLAGSPQSGLAHKSLPYQQPPVPAHFAGTSASFQPFLTALGLFVPLSAPVVIDQTYQASKNNTLNIDAPGVLQGADPTGLTITDNPQAAHGELTLNLDGSFTYTPDHNYTGPDTFTYTATDGSEPSNQATVTITVSNDPPVAASDN